MVWESGARRPSVRIDYGRPGRPQNLPDIPLLLQQSSGDRERAATADGTVGGLDEKASFVLDGPLSQRSLGSVVTQPDALDLKEGSHCFFAL